MTRGTFDEDLDLQPRRPAPEPDEPVEVYQRLIANPFLAVLAWLVSFYLFRESLRRQNLPLFLTGFVVFFGAFFLMHFHCLDCGATGWLVRSRQHACPAVVARRQGGWARRWRGPAIKIQLAAWFIFMIAALVLGMLAVHSLR